MGNVGINITGDSALHVGARNTNPQTTGIRMGNTSEAFSISTDSYGIEICSDADTRGGGTIDFTYPFASGAFYAGRMFYENNSAYFGWNANYVPATSEIMTTPQMTLDRFGILAVQSSLSVPVITLNGTNMSSAFTSDNITTNTLFVSGNSTMRSSLNVLDNITTSTLSVFNNISSATLFLAGNGTMRSSLNVLNNITTSTLSVFNNISLSTLFFIW